MKYEESATVELKSEVNADFKKEVIALANTDGGTIYIGIDNSGQVAGVSNPDEIIAQVGNMIRDGIKPDLTAYTALEAVSEDNVKIIRVTVLRGVKRPYHLTDKGDLSRKNIESSLAITKQLALKLINGLLEERKIKKSGMARSVRYFIR